MQLGRGWVASCLLCDWALKNKDANSSRHFIGRTRLLSSYTHFLTSVLTIITFVNVYINLYQNFLVEKLVNCKMYILLNMGQKKCGLQRRREK